MPRVKSTDMRRRGRVAALQCLFASDFGDAARDESLDWLAEEDQLPERVLEFARQILQGVTDHRPDLDDLIQRYAPTWPVSQISPLDRNALRIAIFELLHSPETPPKTAVNEAVDLAKEFGSESSARFVNGVLGSVMAEMESARLASA